MAAQAVASSDQIQFLANQRPALEDGTYEISVTQEVAEPNRISGNAFSLPTPLQFAIAGPRFSLAASDILEIFPPRSSTGDFFNVLPHLIIDRGTLPWERSANESAVPVTSKPPWLALLVFVADEIVAVSNTTVAELKKQSSAGIHAPVYTDKPGDPPPNAAVTLVQVTWGVLKNILPSAADLNFLVHARKTDTGDAHAVVIGNRLPEEGQRVVVHLVSVEDLYDGGSFTLGSKLVDSDVVQLLSLYSWDFFCLKDELGHFADLMNNVTPGPFRLGPPTLQDSVAKPFIQAGFAPLTHHFRQGDTSVSWYHGPLIPVDGTGTPHYNPLSPQSALSLPGTG